MSDEMPLEAVGEEAALTHGDGEAAGEPPEPVWVMRESAAPELGGPFGGDAGMCLGLPVPPAARTPNFGDALLLFAFLAVALMLSMGAFGLALYLHWFGLRNAADAASNTKITLATEVAIYGLTLACAVPFFRMVWGRAYFAAIHWHGRTAIRLRYWLIGAALLCNGIAMVGNLVLPFPKDAPVDKLFDTSTDAWLLFVFGVTVAPFFEEMIFRGFLVPAMATAWDWCRERMTGARPRGLDAEGNPVWSRWAMLFAALTVSLPFALMHADQVAKAWGPLVLLYCVSLILCAVRMATRSLAASTMVHSVYNLMLFLMMLVDTGGFRHLGKMQ